jgi:hypothetical protein
VGVLEAKGERINDIADTRQAPIWIDHFCFMVVIIS